MKASFGEPFVVSTHSAGQKLVKGTHPHVFATHSSSSSSSSTSEGLVTVSVQGDGVHVYDLTSLHSISSYSLGPATSFTCPAISHSNWKNNKTYITHAVIASSSELSSEEEGDRTLWSWSWSWGEGVESSGKKSCRLKEPIALLLSLPEHVLVVSKTGSLTLLDPESHAQTELWISSPPPQPHPSEILRVWSFPRNECKFLPGDLEDGMVVVCLMKGNPMTLQSFVVQGATLLDLGSCSLRSSSSDSTLGSVSLSSTGHLSLLSPDGTWTLLTLTFTPAPALTTATTTSPPPNPINLSSSLLSLSNASILALSSTHILLAAPSLKTSELYFHIWDLKFEVLLAIFALPMPASLSSVPSEAVRISLEKSGNSSMGTAHEVVVTLSPPPPPPPPSTAKKGKKKDKETTEPGSSGGRSSVLILPVMCPTVSTLSNAIGRAMQSRKWMKESESSNTGPVPMPMGEDEVKVLEDVKSALEKNRVKDVENVILGWVKGRGDVDLDDDTPSHTFMCELLEQLLQPTKQSPNIPYSSAATQKLLEDQLVSSSMVGGGLLNALRLRNDWPNVELALETVKDLTEHELVRSLSHVLSSRSPRTHEENADPSTAMDVDPTPTTVPQLKPYLAKLLSHPSASTPSTSLRHAFRTYLTDALGILEVLKVVEGWLERWLVLDVSVLPMAPKPNAKPSSPELPPISNILAFTNTLLDSTFLLLLDAPTANSKKVLESIQGLVEIHSGIIDASRGLGGVLEPFVRSGVVDENAGKKRRKKFEFDTGFGSRRWRFEEIVL